MKWYHWIPIAGMFTLRHHKDETMSHLNYNFGCVMYHMLCMGVSGITVLLTR